MRPLYALYGYRNCTSKVQYLSYLNHKGKTLEKLGSSGFVAVKNAKISGFIRVRRLEDLVQSGTT